MKGDVREGVVKSDPARRSQDGDILKVQFVHHQPNILKGAGVLDRWDHFGSTLLAINFMDGEAHRADGSAVLIGPGLALAARHVFDPVLKDMVAGRVFPTAISVMPTGLLIWRVRVLLFW